MIYNDDEKDVLLTIYNVLSTPDGFDFVCFILDKLNAFDRGNNFENVNMNYANNAVRAKGQELLELILQSDVDKYMQIMNKRKEVLCQNKKI